MAEKKLFSTDDEVNSNITFLATHNGKTRLMSFKSDPWLEEDDQPEEDEESFKHSIFLFNGTLGEKQAGVEASKM